MCWSPRSHPYFGIWWPHGHIIGWEHSFVHEVNHFFEAIINDTPIAPYAADFEDGYRCAVICDADGWEDFEDFADAKLEWFKTFMDLRHGVPSADTFRRVLSTLDPDAFERCFINWMQSVVTLSGGKLVAIDGKSLRRSFERGWDKSGMAVEG